MIVIRFGKWRHKATSMFIYDRVFRNGYEWTPLCIKKFRYIDHDIDAITDVPPITTEPYIEFCEWVAEEIFGDEGDYWENVKDAFPELACRRLHKLGIVNKEGDKWIWVDRKELEE